MGNNEYNNRFIGQKKKTTMERINEIQDEYKITIPKDLSSHYIKYNGGCLEKNWFINNEGDQYVLHEFLFIGVKNKIGNFEECVYDFKIDMNILPDNLVPFAIDEGGAYYCMDTGNMSIFLWLPEFYDDKKHATRFVAKSLQEFISGMNEYSIDKIIKHAKLKKTPHS